jgi:hypothetical protein
MLSIITACSRPKNLLQIIGSINFNLVDQWIIVYDTSKSRSYTNIFEKYPKIKEVECDTPGVCGHPQINYALDMITDGFVYILDDDNVIHPNFWNVFKTLDINYIYTWDQVRGFNRTTKDYIVLKGGNINKGEIDTAQFIVPKKYIDETRWVVDQRFGDFHFIKEIHDKYNDFFKYIPIQCAFWNRLQPSFFTNDILVKIQKTEVNKNRNKKTPNIIRENWITELNTRL